MLMLVFVMGGVELDRSAEPTGEFEVDVEDAEDRGDEEEVFGISDIGDGFLRGVDEGLPTCESWGEDRVGECAGHWWEHWRELVVLLGSYLLCYWSDWVANEVGC